MASKRCLPEWLLTTTRHTSRCTAPTRATLPSLPSLQQRRHESSASGYSATSSTSSAAEVANAQRYCMELLRTRDAASHTLVALVPGPAQAAYVAIRAFNVEVARVADTASTSTVAAMRLAFWRDAAKQALAGSPPKQPVAIALAAAASSLARRTQGQRALSTAWLNRVVAARERHLDGRPYPSVDSLERYAEDAYSSLLYLTLQALPVDSLTVDHVASHVGKAVGIVAVLRGVPLLAFPPAPNHHSNNAGLAGDVALQRQRSAQGVVTLPLDVMAEAGVREEDVLRYGAEAEGLRDAVFRVATRASDHLITARTMIQNLRKGQEVGHDFEHQGEEEHAGKSVGGEGSVSEQAKDVDRAFGVLMPAVPTQMWLDKLQSVDFDIFNESLRRRDWKLPMKAWLANRRKSF